MRENPEAPQQHVAVWAQAAPGGVARYPRRDAAPAQKAASRGFLLALGSKEPAGEQMLEALFAAYYAESEQPPVRRLQQAWARASSISGHSADAPFLAAVRHEDLLYLAHGADSRAYLWREDRLYRLTHDQAGSSPYFYRPLILQTGDRFLLSSAGQEDVFPTDGELAALAQTPGAHLPDAVLQLLEPGAVSVLIATVTGNAPPQPAVSLARWQVGLRLTLLLAALVQLAFLIVLRLLQ